MSGGQRTPSLGFLRHTQHIIRIRVEVGVMGNLGEIEGDLQNRDDLTKKIQLLKKLTFEKVNFLTLL